MDLISSAAAADFSDGGDSAGSNRVLGNNDSYTLALETGGTTAITIDTAQDVEIANTLSLVACVSSTTGVIYRVAKRFLHSFSHPTGSSAIPAGRNIFLGENAGNFTTGSTATLTTEATNNVAVGDSALVGLTLGQGNLALGAFAGSAITTGDQNVCLGTQSAGLTTTGDNNMAIGTLTFYNNLTGSNNVAVGTGAAKGQTNRYSNVAIGSNALYGNKKECVAIGQTTLNGASGDDCVAIGSYAGINNTSTGCLFLGHKAGYRHTSGGARLIIDNTAQANAAAEVTNSMLHGAFNATAASQTLRLNGLVGVNATPAATLDVAGISDVVQLKVAAHTTQTANVAEWYDKDGAIAGYITGDCDFGARGYNMVSYMGDVQTYNDEVVIFLT
jgi:hypothetical protein